MRVGRASGTARSSRRHRGSERPEQSENFDSRCLIAAFRAQLSPRFGRMETKLIHRPISPAHPSRALFSFYSEPLRRTLRQVKRALTGSLAHLKNTGKASTVNCSTTQLRYRSGDFENYPDLCLPVLLEMSMKN